MLIPFGLNFSRFFIRAIFSWSRIMAVNDQMVEMALKAYVMGSHSGFGKKFADLSGKQGKIRTNELISARIMNLSYPVNELYWRKIQ